MSIRRSPGLLYDIFAPPKPSSGTNVPSRTSFRRRRAEKVLVPLLETIFARQGGVRVLDLGGSTIYWTHDVGTEIIERYNCSVEIVNLDPVYLKPDEGHPRLTHAQGDARRLPYPDLAFDLVHSNSLLEHVGNWSAMRSAAEEIRRLAPAYYVQVPYFWFPYESHFRMLFFHWLPEQIEARLMMRFALGVYGRSETLDVAMDRVQGTKILDRKQMRSLFADAQLLPERVLGLTKSLIAVRKP